MPLVNRLVTTNLDGLAPDRLPPTRREGPARVLFVHGNILGFVNVAEQLKAYAADRDDLDAVHVDLVAPTWLKVLGKSVPGLHAWDQHQDRHRMLWGGVVARWLRGPLEADRRFDVVHCMTQVHAWGMVRHRRRGGDATPRFAVNVDSTVAAETRDFGTSPLARAWFRRAERATFAAADLVSCRNAWAARSVREDYGLPESRVHLAPNSIRVGPDRRPPAPAPGDRLPRLAFVGNNWRRKGGDLVLAVHQRAFAGACELHVFGDRVERDESARNVTWHGRVPRARLLEELLPSMDGFVLASRWDMLPWAALEAAAAGLPVVATATGAIPDVVREGETGFLFDPGDATTMADGLEAALARLLRERDAAGRRAMGDAARAHVAEHFDPDRTYPGLLDRLVALAEDRA